MRRPSEPPGGGVAEEFYKGFAQRARDLAENADPFTRRRLLELARRYVPDHEAAGPSRRRATPPGVLFSGSGEV
ncbi:hypothetical protein [Bradyrhizobium agreste]|uniref:hypothetical protein n=1 Tax=Bradyrhizobium agreste TaxID=2751811 RepID=UPI001FE2721D|nr:hypothetical protein [Bradyrhizobium agreste]